MGTEQSKRTMPQLEGVSIEVTNSYVLRQGTLPNGERCSVFSGAQSPLLITLSKNLKTHRHPSILKFFSSGEESKRVYLVTEQVYPLSTIVSNLSALQICVGLHSVLTALTFLHNQAHTSHNNVCTASVFVTAQGVWKLSGLEFMRKFTENNNDSLLDVRQFQNEKCLPPEGGPSITCPAAVDVYGFGVFVNEVLQRFDDDELPGLVDFLRFCKERMMEKDPRARAELTEVLAHPFFSHDFIRLHKFLAELPLKVPQEKADFFRELEQQLMSLPESMVAAQLTPLLLSRIVVLDMSAQQYLLPILLRPRSDSDSDRAVFGEDTFREFVVPKLLQMFCVRDASVRLLLLSYLPGFIHMFTEDQLKLQLLPELLVGIKDVDDELVMATLRALASLVGVLGGAAVVGGERARLFSDGRPAARKPRREVALPERPSPDGGEDTEAETWSDWEQQSEKELDPSKEATNILESAASPDGISADGSPIRAKPEHSSPRTSSKTRAPTTLADLDALDIKCPTPWKSSSADDFFRDMEPVISKTQVVSVPEHSEDKFGVEVEESAGEAWDTFDDWEGVPG